MATTADAIFDSVLALMFAEASDKPDYQVNFISQLNMKLAETFEINNALRRRRDLAEFPEPPIITALTDEVDYEFEITRSMLPLGIAGDLYVDDDETGISNDYRERYQWLLNNKLSVARFECVKKNDSLCEFDDWYGYGIEIPTRLSQLINDVGFITSAPVESVNGKVGVVLLTAANVGALPANTFIPVKVSELANDSGYQTAADVATAISGKQDTLVAGTNITIVGNVISATGGGGGGAVDSVNGYTGVVVLTAADVGALPDSTVIPTDTSDLTNGAGYITSADIPANVSAFTNDAGYITAAGAPVQSVNGQTGSVSLSIPTKVSDLNNDSGYQTAGDVSTAISGKQDTLTAGTGISIVSNVISATGGGGGGAVDSVNGYTGTVVLTAADVGALPDTTPIPANTSDLNNDSGFITSAALPTKVSDLTNDAGYITSAAIPTDVSDFTNDAGYITSADIPTNVSAFVNDAGYLTSAPVTSVNGYTGAVVLTASDVSALPSSTVIPTDTGDLTNGAGFITAAGAPVTSVNGQTGAVTISIPANVSDLNNDSGYQTASDVSTAIAGQTKETWSLIQADGTAVAKTVVLG